MNKDSTEGFITGLIIGALAGVVVGFLYAPQTGTETRRVVKENAAMLKDRVSTAAVKVKHAVRSRVATEEE